ncbi:ribonuclease J [Spiroplasma endosymbiont of Anurida maritima]|uniref:ribonuclease J n=1 Tax=Spiroplasma endosymbiont of Anurida maritima TaxID=2967972 RepID=UPI0036D2CCE8
MSNIKFFALGGLDERGKNLYCLEVDNNIFLFDAGVKKPGKGILGIDVVVASYDYLKENKNRIKGIFISKAADFSSGGVSYLLKDLPINVYASDLSIKAIEISLNLFKIKNKSNLLKQIKSKDVLDFGDVSVEVFSTTSNIPNSFGFAVKTKAGVIIYTGDYIFDAKADRGFEFDMQHLNSITKNNEILLLLSDSATASRKGYTAPNHKITPYIERAVQESKGRIILACYEQDIQKIKELLQLLDGEKRFVGIYGQTLYELLKMMIEKKQINLKGIKIVSLKEAAKMDNSIILVSGSGERLYSRLIKIATSNDENLEINETDTIVLATPPDPGSELNHANVLDELARTIAKVVPLSDKKVWTMSASYEDIKLMTSICKPKYFIPLRGLYKEFVKARDAAVEAGVKEENVIIIDNGQVVNFENGKLTKTNKNIKVSDTYVDGIGVGDIGSVVLKERNQLATDGVAIIGASVDAKSKKILSLIDTQLRGVIFIQESSSIFKKMQSIVTDILEKNRKKHESEQVYDLNGIKGEIRKAMADIIKNETGKTPIILVTINEL